MINRNPIIFSIKHIKYSILFCSLLILITFTASSQVTVYPIQDLNFGTFSQGNSGGTVGISATGSRSASGDIILINTGLSGSQAIFEIEAPAGSMISILNDPTVTLTGSNGGSLTLHIGDADLGSPFNTTATPPDRTRIQIGGTLIVGDRIASPPGIYEGTFSVTFNQE